MSARRFARRLAARLGLHVRSACRCPVCDEREQNARAAIGMPALHPERIVRSLKSSQEWWLDVVAAELWPYGEYTAIAADPWREDEP